MRFKYYLRGLGLGILFTVLILAVTGSMNGKMSDDEIMSRAQELGMIMPEKEQSSEASKLENIENSTEDGLGYGVETTTEIYIPAVDSSKNNTEVESDKTDKNKSDKGDKGSTTGVGSATGAGSDTGTDNGADELEESVTTYTISVKRGQVARDIAEKLYSLGLVDDAEKFRKYVGDKGKSHSIHVGTYEIPEGADYDEIIKILTN